MKGLATLLRHRSEGKRARYLDRACMSVSVASMKGARSMWLVPVGPEAWLRRRYPAAAQRERRLLVAGYPARSPQAAGPAPLATEAAECKTSRSESWARCCSGLWCTSAESARNAIIGRCRMAIGNRGSSDLRLLVVRRNSTGPGAEQGQEGAGGMDDMVKMGDRGASILPQHEPLGRPLKSSPERGSAAHGQFSQWKPEYQAENVVPPNIR